MNTRLSVIVPTCGRPSLAHTLDTIRDQALEAGDEVLVIGDGPQPWAEELFRRSGLPGRYAETPPTHDFGASQRNRGLELAAGHSVAFMDDDDGYAPGAFAAIRAAMCSNPGRPHLFRMRYADTGRLLWADRTVAEGNVSTQMIVFPNRSDLPRWKSHYTHDHTFIVESLVLWPAGALVWRDEVIAVIRPHAGVRTPANRGVRYGPLPVEECPYRAEVRGETAACRLVQDLAGVAGPHGRVSRDVCLACCNSFPPTPGWLNPVVASVLYSLAEESIACGGLPGCHPGQAAVLRRWAEPQLDTDPPDPPPVPPAAGPARPLERVVPPPAVRCGPPVRRWAVGVTTAPRRSPTLAACLDSLARAGWDRPRLFADAAVAIDPRFAHLPVTARGERIGAWPNFYLALAELLLRDPDADAYLLVQDDVVVYDRDDLRGYLEAALWPADPIGAVSLFCSAEYTHPEPGWHEPAPPWVWGAQAFVFPRESAKRLVADTEFLDHRWTGPDGGLAHIDVTVGRWAARHGLPVYCPTPSLTQHVGHTSTLWPDSDLSGGRRADRFAGDG